METQCSRFYAVISGTSSDINMGSSRVCLELKNWQFIFLHLMTFFVTLTLKKGINYLIFWVLLNRYGPGIFPKSYKVTNSMVICLPIEYNGGYSGRWPSGCGISKTFYCYLNCILLSLSVKWYADMTSSSWNIITKPTAQSFHFDCRPAGTPASTWLADSCSYDIGFSNERSSEDSLFRTHPPTPRPPSEQHKNH